jgi:hypothetical protein
MSNNEEKKTTQHGFTFRNFTSRTWEKQIYTSHKNEWIREYEKNKWIRIQKISMSRILSDQILKFSKSWKNSL